MTRTELNEMIQFLFENKITTHIDTYDNFFYNGLIIELHESFLVLQDRILGETLIGLSNIKRVEKVRGKKNDMGN